MGPLEDVVDLLTQPVDDVAALRAYLSPEVVQAYVDPLTPESRQALMQDPDVRRELNDVEESSSTYRSHYNLQQAALTSGDGGYAY
ncbi:hypothetical protein [Micromonospora sp. SH-82]|uniref:hypothetical protein n=1 Tax=Micromonospora sp. SH-82 TaxID=3132938 RepID=UPI003EC1560E